jgi:hypothetical protein
MLWVFSVGQVGFHGMHREATGMSASQRLALNSNQKNLCSVILPENMSSMFDMLAIAALVGLLACKLKGGVTAACLAGCNGKEDSLGVAS